MLNSTLSLNTDGGEQVYCSTLLVAFVVYALLHAFDFQWARCICLHLIFLCVCFFCLHCGRWATALSFQVAAAAGRLGAATVLPEITVGANQIYLTRFVSLLLARSCTSV